MVVFLSFDFARSRRGVLYHRYSYMRHTCGVYGVAAIAHRGRVSMREQ